MARAARAEELGWLGRCDSEQWTFATRLWRSELRHLHAGHFTRDVRKYTSDVRGFASDTYPMDESELSYALGKDGTTRRKLARAAGCIMEYVGQVRDVCRLTTT